VLPWFKYNIIAIIYNIIWIYLRITDCKPEVSGKKLSVGKLNVQPQVELSDCSRKNLFGAAAFKR